MLARRERPVPGVDPRDDLVAEVGVVVADARRVEELGAADRGPGVDPDDDRRRRLAASEELVGELREVPRAKRRAVAPHVELPGVALDLVDRWVAPLRLVVVAGRQVD